MKKLVIFGFDGTIVNTSPGILYCLNTTALTIGHAPVKPERLYDAIGLSLVDLFRKLYDMTDDEIEYATNNYSKMYSQKGKGMFIIYDGVLDAIKQLKENGIMIAVATQKHKMFVTDMLKMLNIKDMVDVVCATDVDASYTKDQLLLRACEKTGVSVEDSVLIGDSDIEAAAASQIGMDFVAALYGWGFGCCKDINKSAYRDCADKASELVQKLLAL